MNKEKAEGQWMQLKGKLKETWGNLTDNDMTLYEGKRDQFVGKVSESYGIAKEEVEKKLGQMEQDCNCSKSSRDAA